MKDWEEALENMLEKPKSLPESSTFIYCDGCGSWEWKLWYDEKSDNFWCECTLCGRVEDSD